MTRPIGRRRSDASPVTNAVNGWLARMPRRSRAEVPELPRSITSSGSARPPTPTPSTSHVPSSPRTIAAPIARSAAAVLSTSSPSRSPVISVRPTASAPSISARCEIDLSPGTLTTPASGAAGREPVSGEAPIGGEGSVSSFDITAEGIEPGSQIGTGHSCRYGTAGPYGAAESGRPAFVFDRPRRLWQWRAPSSTTLPTRHPKR